MLRRSVLAFAFVCSSSPLFAQSVLTPFEQSAVQAFNPNNKTFSSISMTGSAVWTAGSLTESGTVTLQIFSDGSTSETWNLPSQSHTYQSTALANARTCTYTDASGKQQTTNDASCLQAIPWFAPGFAMSPTFGSLYSVADTTQASDTASGYEKLSFTTNFGASTASANSVQQSLVTLQQATLVNVSYDHLSALPASLRCDRLLDSNAAHMIENEAVFSDYRLESGYMLPHHIVRSVQRTVQADITITSVTAE
jgi:hypothetical protein